MAISPKYLVVKDSTIPGSGKGLFTTTFIAKGTRIAEYTGKVTTWKDADHEDGANGYIYYVKRSHVIDARKVKNSIARYANDANGLTKVKGITNNCEYIEEGLRVYVHAKRDIQAGSEILVPYGPEYWQVIRFNRNLAIKEAKAQALKERKALAKAARVEKAVARGAKLRDANILQAKDLKTGDSKRIAKKTTVTKGKSKTTTNTSKKSVSKKTIATKTKRR